MYQISVPVSMLTVNEKSLPQYGELLTKIGAKRVFLCCVGGVYRSDSMIATDPGAISKVISYFRGLGLEVGIWVNSLGHGAPLAHEEDNGPQDYTFLEGADGTQMPYTYCPLDPRFSGDFARGVEAVAALKPDLIMLDDDLRFFARKQLTHLACFCPRHLAMFYEAVGEEVPRDQLETRIFTGGANRYRDAYLDIMGETMLSFARLLRQAVDRVDSTIRLGASITTGMWDFSGTDVIELARAFAGNTRPFARIAGAPYHDPDITRALAASRQQCAWGTDSGVELFCEGDTYPRPRYRVPSRPLELFDLAMLADGTSDGMLQYIFDYTHSLNYEMGYVNRLTRNLPLRQQVAEMFGQKRPVGIWVFEELHKLRQWQLPETLDQNAVSWLPGKPVKEGAGAELLSRNSIPTSYAPSGYPVLVMGENARYLPEKALKNGAIVDVAAARILQDRGIDVGLLDAVPETFASEYFTAEGETVRNITRRKTARIRCAEGAAVESWLLPGEHPGSYRYENRVGQRFFVLAFQYYTPGISAAGSDLQSWCRRRQLVDAVSWLCGKALPAVLEDAPNAWVLASTDGKALSVMVINLYLDSILDSVIRLDKEYHQIRCVNCTARLDGNTVQLSEVAPYGFAAFEVF